MTAKKDDVEKTDEETKPLPEGDAKEEGAPDEVVAVVEPAPVSTGTTSGLLEEAIVQVNKLAELREQEVRRQERLITQMQDVVARHTRTNRALLWIAGFTLVLVGVLAFGIARMGTSQLKRAEEISTATSEIRNTASAIDKASGRIDDLQLGLTTKLDNTVDAMRRERDEVKTEVRTVLNDHNASIVAREFALKDEEERLVAETKRVKEERLVIIGDAIERLEAVAGDLSNGESAPKMEIVGAEEDDAPEAPLPVEPDPAAEAPLPDPAPAAGDAGVEYSNDPDAAETAEVDDSPTEEVTDPE